jgi:hypothetical protein
MHHAETKYGFEYGCAKVNRYCSDEKKGWIFMGVETPKEVVEIYVTKTGKVTVTQKKKIKVKK